MRVLLLAHKPPYPIIDGGCKAIESSLMALVNAGVSVDLLTFTTHKHPGKGEWPNHENFNFYKVPIDTRVKTFPAIKALIQNKSYNLNRFKSKAWRTQFQELTSKNTYDIIHAESLFSLADLDWIKSITSTPVIYRSHNVEASIWFDLKEASGGLKKPYLNLLAKQIKKAEMEIAKNVTGIIAIQFEDEKWYSDLGIQHTTTLLPSQDTFGDSDYKNNSFYHLGAMDWQPNLEGVQWLIEEIWPMVLKEIPEAKLSLAGKNFPKDVKGFKGINLEGEVESSHEFIQSHGIALIPLKSGGGIKIKLLEAAALGKPVVSTSKGLEGTDLGEDEVFLGNTAQEFADAMIEAWKKEDVRGDKGRRLKTWARKNLGPEACQKSLVSFYKEILEA